MYFVQKLCTFVRCEALPCWLCLSVVYQFSECSNVSPNIRGKLSVNVGICASQCRATRKKIKDLLQHFEYKLFDPPPSFSPPPPVRNKWAPPILSEFTFEVEGINHMLPCLIIGPFPSERLGGGLVGHFERNPKKLPEFHFDVV